MPAARLGLRRPVPPLRRPVPPLRRPAILLLALAGALSLIGAVPVEAARPSTAGPSTAASKPTANTKPAKSGYLEGIDVSHWQGTIDWAQVGRRGVRFAIAKATEGQTYADPTYATNRSGARSNGIAWGAYHYARPDASANDALIEADHYVDTAALGPGDLLPALDLEDAGGLSTVDLIAWVQAWVQRVADRTGAKPLIYTNNSFWRSSMGDTTWFADNGYPLWVANWGVSNPAVPASNWGGHGWTFWQYTSTGSVPGISGDVDRDRFNGTTLSTVTL